MTNAPTEPRTEQELFAELEKQLPCAISEGRGVRWFRRVRAHGRMRDCPVPAAGIALISCACHRQGLPIELPLCRGHRHDLVKRIPACINCGEVTRITGWIDL